MLYKRLIWLIKISFPDFPGHVWPDKLIEAGGAMQKLTLNIIWSWKKVTTIWKNIHLEKFQPYDVTLEWWQVYMLSLKSESGVFKLFQATWLMMLLYVFWKTKNYLCTKKMPKASSKSWRGSLMKTTFAEKWYVCSQAEAWMSHILSEGWGKYSGVWANAAKM